MLGVYVTVQIANVPVPDSTQLPLKTPPEVLLVASAKLPVGVIGVPGEVSVTVTTQTVPWLTMEGIAHAIVVEVVRLTAVIVAGVMLELVE